MTTFIKGIAQLDSNTGTVMVDIDDITSDSIILVNYTGPVKTDVAGYLTATPASSHLRRGIVITSTGPGDSNHVLWVVINP